MASIQKRKLKTGEISYRVQIRLKGQPVQRATFSRLTDAKLWAQSTEVAMRERRFFKNAEAQKHTVNDLLERYEAKLKRENSKRYKDAKQMLKWWEKEIGCYVLVDVNRALISEKIDKLTKRTVKRVDSVTGEEKHVPISAGRLNRYIFAISPAFSLAVNEWEWMDENPFMKIRKFREPRGRVRFLDDEERNKLLIACREASYEHLYIIVVIALSTGTRKGEILNLRWQDINWERKQFVLHETKNNERRVVPLAGHAFRLMSEHAENRRKDTDLVFPSQRGDKPYEIKKSWEGSLKRAGIKDFRFHDLRHCAASYLAMNGASLAEIAEVLGHKTLQMVKRYAHLSEAHTSSVVASMNERIFGDDKSGF